MSFESKICGKVCLSGAIVRSSHYSKLVNTQDEDHVTNIGVLVEDIVLFAKFKSLPINI